MTRAARHERNITILLLAVLFLAPWLAVASLWGPVIGAWIYLVMAWAADAWDCIRERVVGW